MLLGEKIQLYNKMSCATVFVTKKVNRYVHQSKITSSKFSPRYQDTFLTNHILKNKLNTQYL